MIRALACLALFAHSAHADSLEADVTPLQPDWSRTQIDRPLTLGRGITELALDSTTADGGAQPTTVGAGLAYGVTDRLTIRAVHVAGVCTSDESSCMTTPREVGLRAQYGAYRGEHLDVALLGGVEQIPGDASWSIRAGGSLRYRSGSVAFVVEPSLRVSIIDNASSYPTNLTVPVALQYQASRMMMLYLRSGITGYGEDGGVPVTRYIADEYMVPIGAGLVASVDKHVDLAMEIVYPDVAGPLGLGFTAPIIGSKVTVFF